MPAHRAPGGGRTAHRPRRNSPSLVPALLRGITVAALAVTNGLIAPGSTAVAADIPPPPAGYRASQLLWQDDFAGRHLDASKWNPFMTSRSSNGWPWFSGRNGVHSSCSAMSSPGYNYADYLCPSQAVTANGSLRLIDKPNRSVPGYGYQGGAVTTYGHFQLRRGYVQIRAKMPNGSAGGWPAIWFLPGPGGSVDRGEIDLYEGGFTAADARLPAGTPTNDIFISHYHGPHTGWVQAARKVGDLTRGFHVYGMEYKPGVSIKTFIDGHLVGYWRNDINTDPYEIIINTGRATGATAGWHTTGSPRTTTSMLVSSVQVYR